ncbi:hypothetical protein XH83_25090 [Bradyrhizobium sp. CCBAU 53351]|uniref:hypothetical protein n=1 Tax=Bradyrhizobium sp. CCBAU 53351 TaxID=1325114 RepID=UPI0018890A9B|nr:hypothetical protein [Bradyrhizobium sp. CCBAU 53351]QOZ78409.1 hypothetical protein XH83_25090 [Bradyrhizobium sp. CCBAU 53351]
MIMASQSQIEANRRNACQSTGPRSAAGKKRAAKNALRHGLCASFQVTALQAKLVDKLAQQIAGASTERLVRELAREVAIATFDLARVRRVKTALIQHELALGSAAPPGPASWKHELRFCEVAVRVSTWPPLVAPDDLSETMLSVEERTAEAVRRALPELLTLDRYEARAIGQRNRALRSLLQLKAEQRYPQQE